MIQLVGLIMSVYACARLLQVPIEQSSAQGKQALLWIISILAVGAIALLTVGLLLSGVPSSMLTR